MKHKNAQGNTQQGQQGQQDDSKNGAGSSPNKGNDTDKNDSGTRNK